VAEQRFEAKAHGFGIGGRTTDVTSLRKELLVDVQGFFHMD
jgi:hypothetical protein